MLTLLSTAVAGGLAVGGLLGAAAHRLPRGLPLVGPPPGCQACGRRPAPGGLLPVVSYVLRRGRCRGCGGPIGWRQPAIASANALLWALVAWRAAGAAEVAMGWALSSTCVLAAAVDIEWRLIPNRLTLAAALAWIPLGLWSGRLVEGLAGAAVFGGLLLLAAVIRPDGMGMGDVKLAAVAGLYLGWPLALSGLFVSLLSASLAGIAIIVFRGRARGATIAMGPFLALGSLAAFLAVGR